MRPDKIRGNVFVTNLPRGLTDEQLAEAFDPYGLVLRAYLARDPATGETRGYGLVQIAPDRAVEAAVAGVNAAGVGGHRVEARRADPAMSITAPTRLRTPGWAPRPAVPAGSARDHRALQRPAPARPTARGGEHASRRNGY
jgi:RNA recognition motif-containing protein